MTEMPNSGFATEVECLANHTTGSSLHLGSHVGHPGGLRFRHRLQRVAGFAWVSYVIMPAAEELFANAGRGGLSPLRKAPPRGAASAGSRHEIRKNGAKGSWGKTQEAVLYLQSIEKFIFCPYLRHGAKPRINPGSRGSRAEVEDVCSLAPPGLASLRRSRRCSKDEHRPVHDD